VKLDPLSARFAGEQALKAVPQRLRQRQDSLAAQLHTLVVMANRAGCYDAEDWLKKKLEEQPCSNGSPSS
jgi:hypothetical protein